MIRLGIVGCGRIARNHLAGIPGNSSECRLEAVIDINREIAESYAGEYGAPLVFTDMKEAAMSAEIDAVILCLPHFLLAPAARLFIENGKHVLVEKPCGTAGTAADYFAAVQEAKANDLVLQPAYVCRFMDKFIAAKELIDNDVLGKLQQFVFVSCGYLDALKVPWWQSAEKAGGFWLALHGTHIIDRLLWFKGTAPVAVYANYSSCNPLVEGETHGMISIEFGDNSCNTITFSQRYLPDRPKENTVADCGSINRFIGEKATLDFGKQLLVNLVPVPVEESGVPPFERQLRDFISNINGCNPAPVVLAADGSAVVKILAAAALSNRERRTVLISEV